MKQNIHPIYREVVYRDLSANYSFLSRSTQDSAESTVWTDGKTYPLVKVEVSSASHPFYTGTERLADSHGRTERFLRRYRGSKPG